MRWLVLLVTACGRLGFDEAGDGGPTGDTLELRLHSHLFAPISVPIAGATAWSTTADGRVDDVQQTGADGRVTLRIEAGGTVSALDPTSMWVTTFAGVEAGDVLLGGLSVPACDTSSSAGIVTLDWVPPAPTPASYAVTNGCSETTVPAAPMMVEVNAAVGSPFDLVVRALDGDGNLIASAFEPGAAFADGDAHAFGAADWVDPIERTVGVTGVTAPDGEPVQLAVHLFTPGSQHANASLTPAPFVVSDETVALSTGVPAGVTRMSAIALIGGGPIGADFARVVALVDAPIGVGTAAPLPPQPSAAVWDPAARTLSWEVDAGDSDAIDVLAGFYNDTRTLMLIWSVRMPPGTSSVVLPELPASLSLPDLATLVVDEQYLINNNYASAGDYRAARQLGEGGDALFAAVLAIPTLARYTGAYALRLGMPASRSAPLRLLERATPVLDRHRDALE